MLDVLIRGGTVVSPDASVAFDVGIKDGRIVAFAAPNSIELSAARTIDARGKYVIPGGIDAHVHFNIGLSPAMRAHAQTDRGAAALLLRQDERAHGDCANSVVRTT